MRKRVRSRAFTLVELLLVVTIIAIVGIVSVSSFSRLGDSGDAEATVKSVSSAIGSLDRSVGRSEIVSYDAVFESGSIGFLMYLDSYRKASALDYSFRFPTATGEVRSVSAGTGAAELHFSASDASAKTVMLSMSGMVQTFSFPPNLEKRWYRVSASLDDTDLNSLEIQYYNLYNVQNTPEKEVRLVSILGWDGTSYDSLTVRNILGKKTLVASGATLDTLEKATLAFEKNGKEMFLEVTAE